MTKGNFLEMGFISACSLEGHHLGKPKWEVMHGRKLEIGAAEEALGNTACWLALHACFLIAPRSTSPGWMGWALLHQLATKKNTLAEIPTDQSHAGNSSSGISSSDFSLFPVKLTNTT